MDTGFDEDEAEFAVLVLAVALEVLSDGDGLEEHTFKVSLVFVEEGRLGWSDRGRCGWCIPS